METDATLTSEIPILYPQLKYLKSMGYYHGVLYYIKSYFAVENNNASADILQAAIWKELLVDPSVNYTVL